MRRDLRRSGLPDGRVVSNVISSQMIHGKYGGVVPELASRAHQRLILQVVDEALRTAGIGKDALRRLPPPMAPAWSGALLVGLNFAKALAFGLGIPFIGVNHMEGHLYSNFLREGSPGYPFLSLDRLRGAHNAGRRCEAPFRHRRARTDPR